MIRALLVVVVIIVTTISTTAQIQAPQYRWIPGLDLVIGAYAHIDKDGTPGPLVHVFGYDRDARVASLLRPAAECYEVTPVFPAATHGAITQVIQVRGDSFAFYHEDGFLKIIQWPIGLPCTPLRVG